MSEILKGINCVDCGSQLKKERADLPTIRPSGFPPTTYIGVCIECQRAHSITGIPIGHQGKLYYYKEDRMVYKYEEQEIEKCLICRKEISEETIKKNKGRFCNDCTAKGIEIEKKLGMI